MQARLLPVLLLLGLAVSCGGGAEGEPLLDGAVTGSYDDVDFDAINGYATIYMGEPLIFLGAGPIHCGTELGSNPPRGYNAAIFPSDLAVGSYGSVLVRMFKTAGGFEGIGANVGTLEITESTADTVGGTVSFSYVDMDGRSFSLSGTFLVLRCP